MFYMKRILELCHNARLKLTCSASKISSSSKDVHVVSQLSPIGLPWVNSHKGIISTLWYLGVSVCLCLLSVDDVVMCLCCLCVFLKLVLSVMAMCCYCCFPLGPRASKQAKKWVSGSIFRGGPGCR